MTPLGTMAVQSTSQDRVQESSGEHVKGKRPTTATREKLNITRERVGATYRLGGCSGALPPPPDFVNVM